MNIPFVNHFKKRDFQGPPPPHFITLTITCTQFNDYFLRKHVQFKRLKLCVCVCVCVCVRACVRVGGGEGALVWVAQLD